MKEGEGGLRRGRSPARERWVSPAGEGGLRPGEGGEGREVSGRGGGVFGLGTGGELGGRGVSGRVSWGVSGRLSAGVFGGGGAVSDTKRATDMENIELSEKRLVELRAKLQTRPPPQDSEVHQLRGLCLNYRVKSTICKQPPVRTFKVQIPSGRVVGKTSFQIATMRCKSGWRADMRSCNRLLWLDSYPKWRGSHSSFSSTGVAADDPGTVLCCGNSG